MDLQLMKNQAKINMEELNIFKPYIEAFMEKDKVCFFEGYGGYYADQEDELNEKIMWFEAEYNSIVYAITHEITGFGECYSFLYIPQNEDEWEYTLERTENKNAFYTYAYVWYKDSEEFSDFGTIGINTFGGGIMRFD